jgi:hypothetical protein
MTQLIIQSILDGFPDMVSEFGLLGCGIFSLWLAGFVFSACHAFVWIGESISDFLANR